MKNLNRFGSKHAVNKELNRKNVLLLRARASNSPDICAVEKVQARSAAQTSELEIPRLLACRQAEGVATSGLSPLGTSSNDHCGFRRLCRQTRRCGSRNDSPVFSYHAPSARQECGR